MMADHQTNEHVRFVFGAEVSWRLKTIDWIDMCGIPHACWC